MDASPALPFDLRRPGYNRPILSLLDIDGVLRRTDSTLYQSSRIAPSLKYDDDARRIRGTGRARARNRRRLLFMISEDGGVETARMLLRTDGVPVGYTALWKED